MESSTHSSLSAPNRPPAARAFASLPLLLALVFFWPVLSWAQVAVDASVQPQVAMVGQQAVYQITIENGTSTPDLAPPDVDGLMFNDRASVSQQTSIINGRRSAQVTLSWFFVPRREGRFVIPGQVIEIRGESFRVPDVSVRVTPQDERLQGILRFEAEIPDKPLYVGEFIPVSLKLFVRRDVTVRNLSNFQVEGDGLTQKDLGEAEQRTVSVEGDLYEMVRWDTYVVPIRAGPTNLQYQLSLQWADPNNARRDLFGQLQLRYQDILLTTDPREVEILELPEEGKPESFTGAIGDFDLTARLATRKVRAGEPIEMTVTLSGKGNFERVSAPAIPEPAGWRVYPPKSRFEPARSGDTIGYEGKKVFEYLLIPEAETVAMVPGFAFSWFDPVALDYRTIQMDPEPIDVLPGETPVSVAQDFTGTEESAAQQERARRGSSPEELLRPLAARADSWVARNSRIPADGWRFWGLQLALVILFAGVIGYRRRQLRLANDFAYARQVRADKAVREWLEKAQCAAREDDSHGFLTAATRAVQEAVAARMPGHVRGETLLLEDIRSRLSAENMSAETREWIAGLFERHDARKFAGGRLSNAEMAALEKELSRVVGELSRRRK